MNILQQYPALMMHGSPQKMAGRALSKGAGVPVSYVAQFDSSSGTRVPIGRYSFIRRQEPPTITIEEEVDYNGYKLTDWFASTIEKEPKPPLALPLYRRR